MAMALRPLGSLLLMALALLQPQADAATTKITSCDGNLTSSNAPVLTPLAAVLGDSTVSALRTFITGTPVGKMLIPSEGSTCIAHMNGTVLGNVVSESLELSQCADFVSLADIPFVEYALGNFTSYSETGVTNFTVDAMLEFVRDISSDEIEDFCQLYVPSVVSCLSSQLFPSLAVVAARYSSGCCADWVSESVADFDYSLTGQLTKIAELFGDLVCAQQAASTTVDSQRCGYTLIQNLVTSNDSTAIADKLLEDLQVPTNQTCLKAEGEEYTDVNGLTVAASSDPTMSGCMVTLDRIASWVSALPMTTDSSDASALFKAGTCVMGSKLTSLAQYFFPESILDSMVALLSVQCLHVPIKYSDGCTYSRTASLQDWSYVPKSVSQGGGTGSSAADASTTATSIAIQTVAPSSSSTSSTSSASSRAATNAIGSLLLFLVGTLAL